MHDGKTSKKCKGVKKAVVKNALTFENYKDCLFNGTTYQAKFNVLRSRKHNVTTECVTKIALSAKDDKRHVIPNDPEHRTLAPGYQRAVLEVYLQKIFNELFEKILKDVLEKELIPKIPPPVGKVFVQFPSNRRCPILRRPSSRRRSCWLRGRPLRTLSRERLCCFSKTRSGSF